MQPDLQLIIPFILIIILGLLYLRIRLKKLASFNSKYNGQVEVYQKYNGEKILSTDYFPQGISTNNNNIKQSYWYKVARIVVKFCQTKTSPQILFLGLGANTSTSLVAKQNPQISQTVVEIDPVMIKACQLFFNLNQTPNLNVIQADAFKLLRHKSIFGHKFDVIVVDIYQGNTNKVSELSTQQSFIKLLIPHLKKDGLLLFNRPAHTKQSKAANAELKSYLGTIFKNTHSVFVKDPRGYKNDLVIGANS